MLARFPVTAVLPAQHADRARDFYRDVLGLELVSDPDDDPVELRAGDGTGVLLTEQPERVPSRHPALSFAVTGLDGLVTELKARGATFVPLAAGTQVAGTQGTSADVADFGALKVAFLRDSEGNIITLSETVQHS